MAVINLAKKKYIPAFLALIFLLSAAYTANAENSGPEFSELYPAAGANAEYAKFTITATASDPDGVNPASTFFQLDDDAKVGVMIRLIGSDKAIIQYVVEGLLPGEHTVKILIQDNLGNSNSVTWSFVVPEGELTPVQPPAPRPGGETGGETGDDTVIDDTVIDDTVIDDTVIDEIDPPQVVYLFPQGEINTPKPIVAAVLTEVYSLDQLDQMDIKLTLSGAGNIIIDKWNYYFVDSGTVVASAVNPPLLSEGQTYNTSISIGDTYKSMSPFTVAKKMGTKTKKILELSSLEGPDLPDLLEESQDILWTNFTGKLGDNPNNDANKVEYEFSFKKVSDGYSSTFDFAAADIPEGIHKLRIQLKDLQSNLPVPIYEDTYILRDKQKKTACTTCHERKPYDHRTQKCQLCHQFIKPVAGSGKDCWTCHGDGVEWPHGPEVFVAPKISGTPTLCLDCHVNSDVAASERNPDSKYKDIDDHRITDYPQSE